VSDKIKSHKVGLDRTTKNYAIYESEDPLGEQQPVPSLYLALEQFNDSPPEVLSVTCEATSLD
jgi:hypothetical protein